MFRGGSLSLQLRGLDPAVTYDVRLVDRERQATFTRETLLKSGLRITTASIPRSEIVVYKTSFH